MTLTMQEAIGQITTQLITDLTQFGYPTADAKEYHGRPPADRPCEERLWWWWAKGGQLRNGGVGPSDCSPPPAIELHFLRRICWLIPEVGEPDDTDLDRFAADSALLLDMGMVGWQSLVGLGCEKARRLTPLGYTPVLPDGGGSAGVEWVATLGFSLARREPVVPDP